MAGNFPFMSGKRTVVASSGNTVDFSRPTNQLTRWLVFYSTPFFFQYVELKLKLKLKPVILI